MKASLAGPGSPAYFEGRAVVPPLDQGVGEGRYKDLLDQLVHERPATAVRHQHVRVLGDRDRAR